MSTLAFVARTDTEAVYTTTAVVSKTQRMRMSEALEKQYGARFTGRIAISNDTPRVVTVYLLPEAA